MPVVPFVPAIAAGIGAAGSIYGASKASRSSQAAAGTAAGAQMYAAGLQHEQYHTTRADMAPWRTQGQRAVNALGRRVEAGPGTFEKSPGYEFTREEGLKGIERAAGAMGGLRSGRHLKAAGRYATDLASTEYDNFLRRYYQSLTPLQSLAGVGMTAGIQTGALGQQAAGIAGQHIAGAGQTQAAGILGAQYPWTQLANKAATEAFNYAMYNQTQNALAEPSFAQMGYTQTAPGSYWGGGYGTGVYTPSGNPNYQAF